MMRILLTCVLTLLVSAAYGEEPAPQGETVAAESTEPATVAEEPEWPELNYQSGAVVLPNKVATLSLTDQYHYLSPEDTEKMLVAWGNPPGWETLGAVVPADVGPFSEEGWAVIVTYIDDGHVSDKDAHEIDYNELLADMKSGTRDESEQRVKEGYEGLELLGWAAPPHYEQATRKLYWAKELKFGGSEVNTLNYDVRVLGREGVLSMNAVAGMPQLAGIETDMQQLLKVAAFNEGYRYEDFNEDTDRMAAYGLGALVAGGIAAKAGFFAKLGALLLAFKKFIVMGLVALGAFLAKLFRGRKAGSEGVSG
jgi:uncharacterized membrane-anchored protein